MNTTEYIHDWEDGLDDFIFPGMRDASPYCECDEVPTQDELDTNTCACCGKQIL